MGVGAENCSWSFLLSVPQLIMISNLQNLISGEGGSAEDTPDNNGTPAASGSTATSTSRSRVSSKYVGGGGSNSAPTVFKPSLQPNDYMDGVIAHMKDAMKERYSKVSI